METIPMWKAIVLGVLQGATEFLPISSSAHLVIFQQWLQLSHSGSFLMAFDVALHFGTLAAVVVYFYRDLRMMGRSFLQADPAAHSQQKIGIYLLIATVPAALFGLTLKNFFETLFADPIPASFFLLITGWILWQTQKIKGGTLPLEQMRQRQAWFIGLAQAAAIFPGISRSGSTIASGLALGLRPEAAVRFSFFMSILAIAGANLLESKVFASLSAAVVPAVLLGVVSAFSVAYLSIGWMLKIVSQRHLHRFSWYCWGFGGFVLLKELFF